MHTSFLFQDKLSEAGCPELEGPLSYATEVPVFSFSLQLLTVYLLSLGPQAASTPDTHQGWGM